MDDLYRANHKRETLIGKNFSNEHLDGADFRWAILTDANFEGAILKDANFHAAHLKGACFRNANLSGANLWASYPEGADITGAKGLPDYIYQYFIEEGAIDNNSQKRQEVKEKELKEKELKDKFLDLRRDIVSNSVSAYELRQRAQACDPRVFDMADGRNRNLLHAAAQFHNAAKISVIAERSSSPMFIMSDIDGYTPYDIAAASGDPNCKHAIKEAPNYRKTPVTMNIQHPTDMTGAKGLSPGQREQAPKDDVKGVPDLSLKQMIQRRILGQHEPNLEKLAEQQAKMTRTSKANDYRKDFNR